MNSKFIFIIIALLLGLTLTTAAQRPGQVTFVNEKFVNKEFGIYKASLYADDEPPFFLGQRNSIKKMPVEGPTLFYTTNRSKQVLLTMPGDSILVRKGSGGRCDFVLLNNPSRKNDFSAIDQMIDSIGQFASIDAVDYILPVSYKAKTDSLRPSNTYWAANNAERDSILYDYWQRRTAFVQRAKEHGRISTQAADFWSRYFCFGYLSKSIMGLIHEPQPLDSFPLFSSVWRNTEYLQDTTLPQMDTYRAFMIQYIHYLSKRQYKSNISHYTLITTANGLSATFAIKDWLLFSITQTAMALNKSSDSLISYFNAHCTNEAYRLRVADKLAFTQQSAQAAGDNVLMDRGKRTVGFADMIAAKKDSVVVIDFWATWCKPCLEEAPHFAALKKTMANQKVSFIAISLDKDRAAWLNFYPKSGPPAHNDHFLLLNHFNSPLAKRYGISAIPRVVVLKDGKVISMEAPPPSSPQLKKLIERYME